MAIGTTAAVDPVTGERTESHFEYTPVDQTQYANDQMMRQAYEQSMAMLNPPPAPHGNTPYWENPATYYPQNRPIDPVEQAKAASAMAYKYIGLRGYQQDLKEGKSAAEAFARWGTMIMPDAGFASSVNALKQPRQGQWVPPNPTTQQPGFYREPTQYGERANYPAAGLAPSTWIEANPKTGEPAHWSNAGRVEQIRTSTKGNEITPTQALNIVSDPYKWQFAQEALGPESTNLVNIAKGGLPKPAASQATAAIEKTAASGPPVVTSKAEFDKLPPGTIYLNKGKPYRKP